MARRFSAHGAQLAAVAVRPLSTNFIHNPYNTITAGSEFTVSMRGSRDDQQMNHAPSMPPPPPPQAFNQAPKQEDDVKSEASYDPLFDEPDAEGEGDGPAGQNSFATFPGHGHGPLNNQHLGRGAIAPKGAPPVLDPTTYATFSPDLLMTAHVDGQVILWDRRVNSPGRGVGRLWMSEKTPPWLMSVRAPLQLLRACHKTECLIRYRHVGLLTAPKYTRDVEMVLLRFTTFDRLGVQPPGRRGF